MQNVDVSNLLNQSTYTKLWNLLLDFGPKIIGAIVVLLIGKWIAKFIKNIIHKIMTKKSVDPTLVGFVSNLAYFAMLLFIIIFSITLLGIETTSFVAILGAAGLAIGLALQGLLSNFASGFLIIIFRPFKIGDYIEGAGVGGTVEIINIFNTQLLTPDNKTIIVPNSKLTGDNLVNYSAKGIRRVDLAVSVGHQENIDKVKKVLADIIEKDQKILKEPPTQIAIIEMNATIVKFAIRPWVKVAYYGDVFSDTTENIKKSFDKEGIKIL
jgi:small conductance mechanosensitive channel